MRQKLFLFVLVTGLLFHSCSEYPGRFQKNDQYSFDLDSIRARGRLIAVTESSSTDYFVFRGEPKGFTYDLLREFTAHIGVGLEIVNEKHLDRSVDMLEKGKADIIATDIIDDSSAGARVRLTSPVCETRRVLVQKKLHMRQKSGMHSSPQKMITKLSMLAGKTVFLPEGFTPVDSVSLLRKSGIEVNFTEVPFNSEDLIQLVENGSIDYAICDENSVQGNINLYPDVDISTVVSAEQGISWGIRKNHSDLLKKEFDIWIGSFRRTETYAVLYDRYFKNSGTREMTGSEYYMLNPAKISKWDNLIKAYSESIRWDWRLLASLICQESGFVPDVKSRKGAYGLMQIMPETGRNFGIDITSSPQNNIKAGIEYIKWLQSIFDPEIPDEKERTRFILAAYNAGPGHVLDAMKLALKNGNDPRKWENNVAVWMLKKSDPRYYNDSVVKNGYFRGKESVAFVNEVLDRYNHYKNIIP